MKNGKFIIIALVVLCSVFACQRDEDIEIAILNIKSEVIDPSYTTVDIECFVECNTKFNSVVVEYALTKDFVDSTLSVAMVYKEGKYRALCENLLDDTTYYLRYIVSNRYSSMVYDKISSFRTLTPSIPTIALDSVVNIWDVKADAVAHLEFDGGAPILGWGVSFWIENTSDTMYIKAESQEQTKFCLQMLQPNTSYRVRAYATNKVGTAYSDVLSILTYALPEVQTNEITDIQLTSALLKGSLIFNGNDTAVQKGFCWSEKSEPTIDDNYISLDIADSLYTYNLSNLKDETQYYVRAYAKNKIGVAYGKCLSFTTQAAVIPTIQTTDVTDIDFHNAAVGGIVTDDGGAAVTERGICYSTTENPTTESQKIVAGEGIGSFVAKLTNLSDSTTYYVRAYAINKKGVAYGEQVSFMTKGYTYPTVSTISAATNVSYTSATVGGNVGLDSNSDITERGICYSTSPNPDYDDSSDKIVASGSGTGSFLVSLTDLTDTTTYYVRAYAINKKGIAYGKEISFTTKAYKLPTLTTTEPTNITFASVMVGGSIISDGGLEVTERGICYSTTENPTISNSKKASGKGIGSYIIALPLLSDSTTYYVRAYAINKKGVAYGEQVSFMTKGYTYASVSTSIPTNISYTSVTVGGNVGTDSNSEITERGVCYSTSPNPDYDDSSDKIVSSGSGSGSFFVDLTNLSDSTTYYVRAYAINKKGIAYGEEVSFTTKGYKLPTLTTAEPTDITFSSVMIGGSVTSDGGLEVTERGVCYSTTENPTISNNKMTSGKGLGDYTFKLPLLSDSTTYYVRAYAINKKGVAYGEQVSFMTKGYTYASVSTSIPTNISYTSVTVGGNVGTDSNSEITERGVCYSTSPNPDYEDSSDKIVASGSGSGSFFVDLTNLSDSTTYYVRAYAINKKGISYGEEVSFTTKGYKLPTLTTTEPTNISYTTATAGGNITSNGGLEVSECGIVYGTRENPTIANDTKIVVDKNIGSFFVDLSNLSDNTIYYVRAYAINQKGISYGVQMSFTTKAYKLASITTVAPTNVSYTSATIGGSVTADGGLKVTERGICYSTTTNPTTENITISSESGTGSFLIDLTNLLDGTTYYARAYAINQKGTAYGEEVSFTTKGYKIPTISTTSVTDINYHTATIESSVTADGGATITERGVCYSTTPNPTTENMTLISGSGTGIFSANLTNLLDSTTYYVRAYAINQKGTAYGEELSFMTKGYKRPTVTTTTPPSNISYTSAMVGGSVVADGGLDVTERGVCYSTTSNPTIDNIKIASGKGLGSFSINLTNLIDSTTYYVRAYAINKKGVSYGDEVSFATVAILSPTLSTIAATDIFNTSAVVGGKITSDGGANVTERGVVYSTSPNPTISNQKVSNGLGTGTFTCTITNLQSGTTYYARAYAVNVNGVGYGEEISFTTMTTLNFPITTTPATDISCTSVVIGGNITGDGGSAITERGVCYSTSPSPTMSDMKVQKGRGIGIFSCTLTDLQDGATYYARAYGINSLGISYGDEVSFTTIKKSSPTVIITPPTKYSIDDATIEAEVTDDGCLDVITRGVVYSTSPNPMVDSNDKVANGEGIGTFSCLLTSLQEKTTYYVRAYAENEKGISYSAEVSFTTRARTYHDGYEYVDLGLSVMWATHNIGTEVPEGVGNHYAWGEVETKTNYSWDTYDYCEGTEKNLTKYCTSSDYGIVDNKKYLEPIDDAAQSNWGGDWRLPTDEEMKELIDNCTWQYTNRNGVKGYKITSKTNGNSIFMPSTTGYKDRTYTTYKGSYGYFYSSSLSSPTSSYYIDCGNSNTNIHLYNGPRCYGRTVRPVWREMELPTVTTGSANVMSNRLSIRSNKVTHDGGAPVTECGLVYCTLPNPTIADTKVPVGSGIGEFSCALTELQEGLTYYVRAYATNQKGTAYGEEISFVAPSNPTYQDGHEYVDLGLSVKWATCNVGANAPEEYGNYFAWGEVEEKTNYDWNTYKYCNGSYSTLTKYNTSSTNGIVDNKIQLDLSDDAAHVNWSGSWRMPTDAEWTELREQCTWEWTTLNGIRGHVVTSKKNGNSIFIPAAGERISTSLNKVALHGNYWSSSLNSSRPCYAWRMNNLSGGPARYDLDRQYGISIRPVCP